MCYAPSYGSFPVRVVPQNDDVDFINRIILGRSIPKDVIPQ
jgi:hypothetical protein